MDEWTATLFLILFSAPVGFALINAAIRLTPKHDRDSQIRGAAHTTASAAWHAEAVRVFAEAGEPQIGEQIRQATRASRFAAEARRVAEKAARSS